MARSKPLALVYFHPKAEDMAKDVAARVRNDGGDVRLVWAHKFRQPEDLDADAAAVIIQNSLGNADLIADIYASFSAGVEIHFVNDDGVFIDQGGNVVEPTTAEPAAPEPAPAAEDTPIPAADDSDSAADGDEDPPAEPADA